MVFTDSMPPEPTTQYPGLYDGTVRNVEKDSQQQPLKRGEIMVSIPSIYDQERPEDWILARPCFPYGHFFVPNPGDKVWLAFQNGDPCKPVWLGTWYPTGTVPEEANASPPVQRLIKTSAGHYLLLNDDSSSASVEIRDGANNRSILSDGESIQIQDLQNSHKIVLSASGIVIETGTGAKVDLSSSGISIDSGQGAKVELTAGMTQVDGGAGTVEVKGSLVKLSSAALQPVLRANIDQGLGNLGAPVPLIGPGNLTVQA